MYRPKLNFKKKLSRKSCLICKKEYSSLIMTLIFRLSWFQQTGLYRKIYLLVLSGPELINHKLQKKFNLICKVEQWAFSFNFCPMPVIYITIVGIWLGNLWSVTCGCRRLVGTKFLFLINLERKSFFVRKRILTSLQSSWQQHSRKRPSILTSSISNCCSVLHQALLWLAKFCGQHYTLPSTGHRRLAAAPKRIQ